MTPNAPARETGSVASRRSSVQTNHQRRKIEVPRFIEGDDITREGYGGFPWPEISAITRRDASKSAQQPVMHPESESRRSGIGSAVIAALLISFTTYLTFAALRGEHGLFSLIQIEVQEARMEAQLSKLRSEHAAISDKKRSLSVNNLDLDLLDAQARKVLGLGRMDEIIVH